MIEPQHRTIMHTVDVALIHGAKILALKVHIAVIGSPFGILERADRITRLGILDSHGIFNTAQHQRTIR